MVYWSFLPVYVPSKGYSPHSSGKYLQSNVKRGKWKNYLQIIMALVWRSRSSESAESIYFTST